METNHQILAIRKENLEIAAAALINLTTSNPCTGNEAKELFIKGVTDWVKETPAGKECWEGSVENLNVGDLLNDDVNLDPEFKEILLRHGITACELVSLNGVSECEYDEVLVNKDDLEESEEE